MYSSPMASLLLTDSSQLTSDSQHLAVELNTTRALANYATEAGSFPNEGNDHVHRGVRPAPRGRSENMTRPSTHVTLLPILLVLLSMALAEQPEETKPTPLKDSAATATTTSTSSSKDKVEKRGAAKNIATPGIQYAYNLPQQQHQQNLQYVQQQQQPGVSQFVQQQQSGVSQYLHHQQQQAPQTYNIQPQTLRYIPPQGAEQAYSAPAQQPQVKYQQPQQYVFTQPSYAGVQHQPQTLSAAQYSSLFLNQASGQQYPNLPAYQQFYSSAPSTYFLPGHQQGLGYNVQPVIMMILPSGHLAATTGQQYLTGAANQQYLAGAGNQQYLTGTTNQQYLTGAPNQQYLANAPNQQYLTYLTQPPQGRALQYQVPTQYYTLPSSAQAQSATPQEQQQLAYLLQSGLSPANSQAAAYSQQTQAAAPEYTQQSQAAHATSSTSSSSSSGHAYKSQSAPQFNQVKG
uniref:(California timema) hypothetical protein n=1 Tax=Timema californicum TaxID=61474 RepID=A0A7R9JDD2_TIMCA|nr:unnamed protein product [Timema californicum]